MERLPERKPIVAEFSESEWPVRTIDARENRPALTPEVREKMDRELIAFGKLMEGSHIWWQLDGGLNVSLRRIATGGDYLGLHKDIDLSIFADDLPRLRDHIESRGYGLFYYSKDDESGTRKFEEILDEEVKPRMGTKMRILAVDRATGNIDVNADLMVAGPIIHYRNNEGQFIGWRGLAYPEKWLTGETIDFKGMTLMLSHPARFIFNKLFYPGKYHDEDLETMVRDMKSISTKDVEDISGVFDQLFAKIKQEKEDIETLSDGISRKVKPGMPQNEVDAIIKAGLPPSFYKDAYGPITDMDPSWVDRTQKEITELICALPELNKKDILSELESFFERAESEEKTRRAFQRFKSLFKLEI